VHVNTGVVIGRVGECGVKGTYSDQAVPTCSLTLEVDEVSQGGKVFTPWLPVGIVGKYAEDVAHSLESGDEVLVDAKLKYRRLIDDKTGINASKWVVSGGRSRRPCQRSSAPLVTATRSPADEARRQASLRAGAAGSAHAFVGGGAPLRSQPPFAVQKRPGDVPAPRRKPLRQDAQDAALEAQLAKNEGHPRE
jgi:single-stranded DNA-binding protein